MPSQRSIPNWMAPKTRTDGKPAIANSASRSVFDHDYGIICHSAKFRRLAGKTQVFLAPKSDYPRSRLTHSIEVAQLGRQLAVIFRQAFETTFPGSTLGEAGVFERLVETACLAHDLGHPPFGHKGAKTLKKLSGKLGAPFDDNRHNIHYLFQPDMAVTDVLLDAVMKYKDPTLYPKKAPAWYAEQEEACLRLLEPLGMRTDRSPACYLMEAADDMINFHSDLEDARKLGIISDEVAQEHFLKAFDLRCTGDVKRDSSMMLKKLIDHIEATLHDLIRSCQGHSANEFPAQFQRVVAEKTAESTKERLNLFSIPYLGDKTYKTTMDDLYHHEDFGIIKHEHVTKPEQLSEKIITFIWDQFLQITQCETMCEVETLDCYQFLPAEKKAFVRNNFSAIRFDKSAQAKYLSRYLSGMTDRYCLHVYQSLHQPLDQRFEAAIKI